MRLGQWRHDSQDRRSRSSFLSMRPYSSNMAPIGEKSAMAASAEKENDDDETQNLWWVVLSLLVQMCWFDKQVLIVSSFLFQDIHIERSILTFKLEVAVVQIHIGVGWVSSFFSACTACKMAVPMQEKKTATKQPSWFHLLILLPFLIDLQVHFYKKKVSKL